MQVTILDEKHHQQLLPLCEHQDVNAAPTPLAMRKSDSRDVRWVEVRIRVLLRPCMKYQCNDASQPANAFSTTYMDRALTIENPYTGTPRYLCSLHRHFPHLLQTQHQPDYVPFHLRLHIEDGGYRGWRNRATSNLLLLLRSALPGSSPHEIRQDAC